MNSFKASLTGGESNLPEELPASLSGRFVRTQGSGAQGGATLVTGLLWRAVNQARHNLKHLHQARDLNTDASHYVLCQSEGAIVYGLYQPDSLADGVKLPKHVHSAAQCFAALVGKDAPNAALILSLPSSGGGAGGANRNQSKVYVVVLEYGVPAVDLLSSEHEAHNALGSEDRPLWSDNEYSYPSASKADFEWLASGVSKASRIAKIPLNPWPWVSGALVMGVGAMVYWAVQHNRQTQSKLEQVKVQQALDPEPKYLQALYAQAGQMASVRADVVRMTEKIFETRLTVPGWLMRSVSCSAVAQKCLTQWERKGGTFDDLVQALPQQKLVNVQAESGFELMPLSETTSTVPLEVAHTEQAVVVARTSWLEGAANGVKLESFGKQVFASGVQWQIWITAGLGVNIKEPPGLWPQVAGVPTEFKHPQALVANTFTVGNVPGPLVLEALQKAPAWVSWDLVQARIGDGQVSSQLQFTLTGTYYAKAMP